MLEVNGLNAGYGAAEALRGFSITVAPGEIVCLLGRNGAGKTTALKAIMGLLKPGAGTVRLSGQDLRALPPHHIPRAGLGYVPQGRRLFANLSVRENLEIGLMTRRTGAAALDRALGYFPALTERLAQRAGSMSGGEQTMLAIARALCIEPTVLMLDEPTEGLMPSMIATIRDVVKRLSGEGVGVLLVEQRIDAVLPVADRIAFMDHGSIRDVLGIEAVREDDRLLRHYLGVGH